MGASLWCYDIVVPPPAPPPPAPFAAVPAPGVSDAAPPPSRAWPPTPPVWSATRSTVTSTRSDWPATGLPCRRCGSDATVVSSPPSGLARSDRMPRATPVLVRSSRCMPAHPVNGHLVGAGFQDNGTQLRTGDTMWDLQFVSDGVGWPSSRPRLTFSSTSSSPRRGAPMPRPPSSHPRVCRRGHAGPQQLLPGAAVVRVPPAGPAPAFSRVAIGTYRVWLSEDVGVAAPEHLAGAAFDQRPTGGAAASLASPSPRRPVWANPARGEIRTMKWASPTVLLVVHRMAVVRYTRAASGAWSTEAWRIDNVNVAIPRTTILTDVAPVPGTSDFYVATTGVVGGADETLWFFQNSTNRFPRTGFRHVLDLRLRRHHPRRHRHLRRRRWGRGIPSSRRRRPGQPCGRHRRHRDGGGVARARVRPAPMNGALPPTGRWATDCRRPWCRTSISGST